MRRILRSLAAILTLAAAMLALSATIATAGQTQATPRATAALHVAAHGARKHHRHRHRHHRRHHSHGAHKRSHTGAARRRAARAALQCDGADLIPSQENLAVVRSATVCLVNRERAAHGERPLIVNGRLNRAAQGHTEEMITQDYFSHYSPAGDTPGSRIRAAGYIYSSDLGYEIGENIAWGTRYLSTPRAIVEAWMASPAHRENILDARYRETGMGVVAAVPASDGHGQPGATYTQDFGVLIKG
ncbi:MAG: CAP domain-containing protein [Solirubrobacteraceae bacterium]